MEVGLKEFAKVANRAGEPVKLEDQQAFGLVALQHRQTLLQPGAVGGLGGLASVDNDFNQFMPKQLAVLTKLLFLGSQAYAVRGLLFGTYPDVTNNFHVRDSLVN